MADFKRYNVAGPPAVLRPMLDLLEANRETPVHKVTRNDQFEPERLTVSMDSTRASAWVTAMRGVPILIEPDELLDL